MYKGTKTVQRVFALLLAITVLGACDDKSENWPQQAVDKKKNNSRISVSDILKKQTQPEAKSVELTEAAEMLITPYSFHHANSILDIALELDPNNKKARTYSLILKPVILQRGIYTRVSPLADNLSDEARSEYQNEKEKIEQKNNSVSRFLLDEGRNIHSVAGLQEHLDNVYSAYKELKDFAEQNKDVQFVMNKSELYNEKSQNVYDCDSQEVLQETEEGYSHYYDIKCKDQVGASSSQAKSYKIGRAEMASLEQYAAGMMVQLAGLTAYDLSGATQIERSFQKRENISDAEAVEIINSHPQLGVLRDASKISDIKDMGYKAVDAMKWARQMQEELCPQGKPSEDNRPNHLLSSGICLTDDVVQRNSDLSTVDELIETTLTLVDGGLVPITVAYQRAGEGESYTTEMNVSAVLDNPPQDLKMLLPTQFNQECESATNVGDPTLAGLFPNEDGQEVLHTSGVLDDKSCTSSL